MKVFFCEKCNEILPKWKIECGKCGYVSERLYPEIEKARTLKKVITTLAVILTVISAVVIPLVICNAAFLFPWQYQARQNRKAILEYARNNYPEAKIVEEHYPTLKFNPTNKPWDVIWFELDGIKFDIGARDGKVNYDDDGYPKARAIAQFDKIIKDGYLKPRNIVSDVRYTFYDDYRKIYPYTGSLYIELGANGSTPREAGWLYDFYKCWKKEGSFLRSYSVNIYIVANGDIVYSVLYNEIDNFQTEDEFYAEFKAWH